MMDKVVSSGMLCIALLAFIGVAVVSCSADNVSSNDGENAITGNSSVPQQSNEAVLLHAPAVFYCGQSASEIRGLEVLSRWHPGIVKRTYWGKSLGAGYWYTDVDYLSGTSECRATVALAIQSKQVLVDCNLDLTRVTDLSLAIERALQGIVDPPLFSDQLVRVWYSLPLDDAISAKRVLFECSGASRMNSRSQVLSCIVHGGSRAVTFIDVSLGDVAHSTISGSVVIEYPSGTIVRKENVVASIIDSK